MQIIVLELNSALTKFFALFNVKISYQLARSTTHTIQASVSFEALQQPSQMGLLEF